MLTNPTTCRLCPNLAKTWKQEKILTRNASLNCQTRQRVMLCLSSLTSSRLLYIYIYRCEIHNTTLKTIIHPSLVIFSFYHLSSELNQTPAHIGPEENRKKKWAIAWRKCNNWMVVRFYFSTYLLRIYCFMEAGGSETGCRLYVRTRIKTFRSFDMDVKLFNQHWDISCKHGGTHTDTHTDRRRDLLTKMNSKTFLHWHASHLAQ